jgi:hypothetical protein
MIIRLQLFLKQLTTCWISSIAYSLPTIGLSHPASQPPKRAFPMFKNSSGVDENNETPVIDASKI